MSLMLVLWKKDFSSVEKEELDCVQNLHSCDIFFNVY